ncbi:MAG: hypothetical protein ACFFCD_08720 [Promethearchaeota archaeon]
MKRPSRKSMSLFMATVLLLAMISLILMPSPAIAQDEKSKELKFTETGSYVIENDFIYIRFVNKRPYIEWYSKETAGHKLSFSIKGLTEYFDKNPNEVYDNGDTIYRYIDIEDPNQLFGKGYDVTKSIASDQITLTFRARGDISDTNGDAVGFADMKFIFKIFASGSGAAVYAPQDGVEMAIEVIVSEWDYFNSENNVLALNTSLKMQSGDSASINGHSVQTTNNYVGIDAGMSLISITNSTGTQMGYERLAGTDNQDVSDRYSYRASGTQITILSTYLNIGKSRIHQMSLGVAESLASPTDQGTGGFGFGNIGSSFQELFQGLPGIFSNILFIEVLVVVVVLAIIVIVLVRRTKA